MRPESALSPHRTASKAQHESELFTDPLGELHEAVGEAPLVVVPPEDLDLTVDHLGKRRIEDRGVRVANDTWETIGAWEYCRYPASGP